MMTEEEASRQRQIEADEDFARSLEEPEGHGAKAGNHSADAPKESEDRQEDKKRYVRQPWLQEGSLWHPAPRKATKQFLIWEKEQEQEAEAFRWKQHKQDQEDQEMYERFQNWEEEQASQPMMPPDMQSPGSEAARETAQSRESEWEKWSRQWDNLTSGWNDEPDEGSTWKTEWNKAKWDSRDWPKAKWANSTWRSQSKWKPPADEDEEIDSNGFHLFKVASNLQMRARLQENRRSTGFLPAGDKLVQDTKRFAASAQAKWGSSEAQDSVFAVDLAMDFLQRLCKQLWPGRGRTALEAIIKDLNAMNMAEKLTVILHFFVKQMERSKAFPSPTFRITFEVLGFTWVGGSIMSYQIAILKAIHEYGATLASKPAPKPPLERESISRLEGFLNR